MNNRIDEEDRKFEELFQAFESLLDDTGFSRNVLRGIRQRMWLLRIVLAIPVITGIAISIMPISQGIILISEWLVTVTTGWNEGMILEKYQDTIVIGLLIFLWPCVLHLLEE